MRGRRGMTAEDRTRAQRRDSAAQRRRARRRAGAGGGPPRLGRARAAAARRRRARSSRARRGLLARSQRRPGARVGGRRVAGARAEVGGVGGAPGLVGRRPEGQPEADLGVVAAEEVLAVAGAVHPRADHRARRGERALAPADVLAHDPCVVAAEVAGAGQAIDERAAVGRLVVEEALRRPSAASSPPRRCVSAAFSTRAPRPCAARCWLSRHSVACPTAATLSAAGTRSAPAQSAALAVAGAHSASAASAATVASRRRGMHRASDGRSPSPAQRRHLMDVWRSFSAASGRRCGPSARRRARGPSAAVRGGLGADRLGIGHRVARAGEPVLDDRRRDLGVELQPDAGPGGEGLQARGGSRQLRGARREVEDVLVPGEPAPAVAVVALDVDPADLGLAARGSRWRRGRRRAPGRRSRCPSTGTPAVVRRAQEGHLGGDPRVLRGVHRAVGAQRDDRAGVARVGPRGDHGRVQHVDVARRGPRPTPPPARAARRAAAGRRAGARDYPFTRKAPRMNGWMRQKYV